MTTMARAISKLRSAKSRMQNKTREGKEMLEKGDVYKAYDRFASLECEIHFEKAALSEEASKLMNKLETALNNKAEAGDQARRDANKRRAQEKQEQMAAQQRSSRERLATMRKRRLEARALKEQVLAEMVKHISEGDGTSMSNGMEMLARLHSTSYSVPEVEAEVKQTAQAERDAREERALREMQLPRGLHVAVLEPVPSAASSLQLLHSLQQLGCKTEVVPSLGGLVQRMDQARALPPPPPPPPLGPPCFLRASTHPRPPRSEGSLGGTHGGILAARLAPIRPLRCSRLRASRPAPPARRDSCSRRARAHVPTGALPQRCAAAALVLRRLQARDAAARPRPARRRRALPDPNLRREQRALQGRLRGVARARRGRRGGRVPRGRL